MSYKVLKPFRDKYDKKVYKKSYTHDDENRISFLIEKGYLEEKNDTPTEKGINHVGGGYYELPNGERVKGKEEALSVLESGE